jgi:hypothetical protein
MRYSTSSGLVVVALSIGEAIAGPAHAHLHRRVHEKRDVNWKGLDWNAMGIDWSSAWAAGQKTATSSTPVAVATPTSSVPPVVATTTPTSAAHVSTPAATTTATSAGNAIESAVSEVVSDVKSLFAGLVGVSNSRTSFGTAVAPSGSAGDNYYGNYGSPYGANIVKVSSINGYDFTNTFTNTQSVPITINIWNKVGHDLQPLSGSALAPTATTLTFVLAAGASQIVAFQANSQVAWAQSCSETAASGAFATTWGECNFGTTSGGSGYDVSAIMNPNNNNYEMTITSTEAPLCTSSRTENFWLTATDPVGDSNGSCYISQSTAHLQTQMGGTTS